MFRTSAQPGLNGRALAYPRGKVVGGSSAINAMISMRGQAADYDQWAGMGLDGWGWDEVLPVFRDIEDHFLGESAHHGEGGEWRVEAPRVRWDVLDAVRDAAVQMGVPATDDFNTGDNEGAGYFHVNQTRGQRWSASRGFLKPALSRPNLRLVTHAEAEKLEFEGARATGIVFHQKGERQVATTRGEIILSAGAIGSVQILQRSGLGPAEWLAAAGVPVRRDLPGIGRNLQDHLQQRAIYSVCGVKTLNETYHSVTGKLAMGLGLCVSSARAIDHGPVPVGHLHSVGCATMPSQFAVPYTAAFTGRFW
jgi:choline dehydrogenase